DCTNAGASLELIGEIKAGDAWQGKIGPGQCVQIMTGAAVPEGADAVGMIEHTRTSGSTIVVEKAATAHQNFGGKGSEGQKASLVLNAGARLGFAEMAIAAQVGAVNAKVFKRPRVAILSTGDECVEFEKNPAPFQIRNSNSVSLGEQARLAGGDP